MPRLPHRSAFALLAACGLCLTAAALPAHADDAPLKGPEVKDRDVPGVEGEFGGERRRYANEQRLPQKVFRDALETLRAPDAPADVRLTDEQAQKFQGYLVEFQKAQKDYQQQHREEVQRLRREASEAPAPKRKDTKGASAEKPVDEMTGKDQSAALAARERLKQINDGQPKVEDVYTKVWNDLSEPQRKAFDAKIAEFRGQQSKDRQERYVRDRMQRQQKGREEAERRAAQREGDMMSPGPDAPLPPRGDVPPARRDRLLDLFSRLRPEQQEELLRRLEERIRSGDDPRGPRAPDNRRRPPRPDGQDRMTPPPPPPSEPPVPPMPRD